MIYFISCLITSHTGIIHPHVTISILYTVHSTDTYVLSISCSIECLKSNKPDKTAVVDGCRCCRTLCSFHIILYVFMCH